MTELARKVCMLGDFGVGKTSLVARFVRNTFSDKYLTTVGVKVDSRLVPLPDERQIKLVLWDIAGKAVLDSLNQNYLRGASGLILVADGTREASLRAALNLLMQARDVLDDPACVLFVNKLDLVERWEVAPQTLAEMQQALFDRAAKLRQEHTRCIDDLKEFQTYFTPQNAEQPEIHGGLAYSHFVDSPEMDETLKRLKASIRCVPLDAPDEPGKCIFTGKPAVEEILIARAY